MAIASIAVDQQATLANAEALAAQWGSEEVADLRPVFRKLLRFDLQDWAKETARAATEARDMLRDRDSTQGELQKELKDVRDLLPPATRWVATVFAAVEFGRRIEHPEAGAVHTRLAVGEATTDDYSDTVDDLGRIVDSLHRVRDLEGLGLDTAFVAEGDELLAKLRREYDEASVVKLGRLRRTTRLHAALATTERQIEALIAARALVVLRTGLEIPPIDLSQMRAAAAPRPKPAAAPKPEPESESSPAPGLPLV